MVLDTMGELARLYSLAAVAFVGGSLAPVGGHNVIEPIAAGVPTFFGPHMAAFRAVATEAMAAGVAWEVPDAAKLSEDWEALLLEPERRREAAVRARELMARSRGATDRMYAALTGMVASVR